MSKMILFLLTIFPLIFAKCPLNGIQSQTDPTKCYYFTSLETDFFKAERACQEYGGHLVSVCNAFENGLLADAAVDRLQQYGIKDFWIGWSDLLVNGTWNWTDPNANCVGYKNWGNGYPGKDDCTVMSVSDGTWQTVGCNQPKAFACEQFIESFPVTTTSVPKAAQCSDGYAYYRGWNSCYKVVTTPYNWQNAENNCIKDGGHLVSIHSADENEFVDNLLHQNIGLAVDVWMGFFNTLNATILKYWSWSDGTPVTFEDWCCWYPTSNGGCGSIESSGTNNNNGTIFWHTYYNCSVALYSVCKKNPNCF